MLADRPTYDPDVPAPCTQGTPVRASERRDLVVLANRAPAKGRKPTSRLADASFLAHVVATKFKVPQTRQKRQAEPDEANASYRMAARRPAPRPGCVLSRKI